MTDGTVGARSGVPRIWLLPVLALAAIFGAIGVELLSKSIVLDLIAWWPIWLLIVLLVIVARGRRIGRVRPSGVIPILATLALGVFTIGHLTGWPVMQSTSQRLVGPAATGFEEAALTARLDGDLRVSAGSSFLYEVGPVRRGGEIGIPDASEQTQNGSVSITLRHPAAPGFYVFSGWDISLSADVLWNLDLDGVVDADLSKLTLSALRIDGSGVVRLREVSVLTLGQITGTFEIVVPPDAAVRVVGQATVPATWEQLSDGFRSPNTADGWLITLLSPGTVTFVEG